MSTITTLTSRSSQLAKKIINGNSQKIAVGLLFDVSSDEVNSLNDLAKLLSNLENVSLNVFKIPLLKNV